ncbi:helix-turn-helix transcriptional regulator [Pseudoxanthomonas sp. LjRoot168]|uniref:helix-turn-helix domain-containing protein n=1 Tax=unclassified Pseudoxanthomonas TaxID=2645906 RepID=UPI003ED11501
MPAKPFSNDASVLLAANLSRLLEERSDVSRLTLSREIGVSDGTLGRIKYGSGNPTLDVLQRIADAFQVEPWMLIAPADVGINRTRAVDQMASLSHSDRELIDRIVERFRRRPRNSG